MTDVLACLACLEWDGVERTEAECPGHCATCTAPFRPWSGDSAQCAHPGHADPTCLSCCAAAARARALAQALALEDGNE